MLESYTFLACNNPKNVKHEGVGLFYKDSLAIKMRDDIAFDETLVIEIMIDKKKIFFTVLYRSPSNKSGSAEFDKFLLDFSNLYENIKKDNPYATFSLVTLMRILNFGGEMVIPPLKEKK